MAALLITNGDAAGELFVAAGVQATVMPWRDILHEGPIRPVETLERLSDIRAAYLAERFRIDFAEIRAEFGARDAVLRGHDHFDIISIWLEHDLYDQLQLLQVLAFFAAENRISGVSLVQADDFLGKETAETILRFRKNAVPVTRVLLQTAELIWGELAAPTPRAIAERRHAPVPQLPFLSRALLRFLEELPAPGSGLGRTEQVVLEATRDYAVTPGHLFRIAIAAEEAAFMGDWSFFRILEDLATAPDPLISGLPGPYPAFGTAEERRAYLHAPVSLTPLGAAVLAGRADAVAVNGIDRWWAGTRLATDACWRFDRPSRRLISPSGEVLSHPDDQP